MNCDICVPKVIVTCHDEPLTDRYAVKVTGLAAGTYYWRVHSTLGNTYAKQFTYAGSGDIFIEASDLPAGFTTTDREFTFDIVSDLASGQQVPFDFKQTVTEIDVEIVCIEEGSFFPSSETIGK